MAVKVGLLALLEAKPGKGPDLGAFLESGRQIAEAEAGTVTWYAFKVDDTTYGIFDTFDDEAARQAHLDGPIAKALMAKADELLSKPPAIHKIDILANK